MMKRSASWMTMVTLVVGGLPGCGAHFHNPSMQVLATDAKARLDEVGLAQSFDGEFEASAELSRLEREAAVKQKLALFDTTLVKILEGRDKASSWDVLQRAIETRCHELDAKAKGVCGSELLGQLDGVARQAAVVESKRHDYRVLARAWGQKEPMCTTEGDATNPPDPKLSDRAPGLSVAHGAVKRACQTLSTLETRLGTSLSSRSGTIRSLVDAIGRVRSFESERSKELAKRRSTHEAARKALQEAVSTEISADEKQALAKAVADTLSAYDTVEKGLKVTTSLGTVDLSGLAEVGKLERIRDQLKGVRTVLDANLKPDEADRDLTPAQQVALATLNAVDAVARLKNANAIRASGLPSPGVLLLVAQKLSNEVEYVERRLERAQEKRALLEDQLEAARTELGFLVDAAKSLKAVADGCGTLGSLATDFEAFGVAQPDCARQTAATLIAFGNAAALGEARVVDTQLQLNGLAHLAAVDASQAAAAQWHDMLKIPVAQMVAFQAAGVKAEDVFRLLSVLELGVIAGGALR